MSQSQYHGGAACLLPARPRWLHDTCAVMQSGILLSTGWAAGIVLLLLLPHSNVTASSAKPGTPASQLNTAPCEQVPGICRLPFICTIPGIQAFLPCCVSPPPPRYLLTDKHRIMYKHRILCTAGRPLPADVAPDLYAEIFQLAGGPCLHVRQHASMPQQLAFCTACQPPCTRAPHTAHPFTLPTLPAAPVCPASVPLPRLSTPSLSV